MNLLSLLRANPAKLGIGILVLTIAALLLVRSCAEDRRQDRRVEEARTAGVIEERAHVSAEVLTQVEKANASDTDMRAGNDRAERVRRKYCRDCPAADD